MAPFWGAKISAASTKRVVTSHATRTSTAPRMRRVGLMAVRAARPPSVVAEPPTPTITRVAPASRAAAISSPVPRVDARRGSLRSGPPSRSRPDARAISTTAVPSACIRHSASTSWPRGPWTVVWRGDPPSASNVPSPPSATGTWSQAHPARSAAWAIAAATWAAVAVPRNLSGAATSLGVIPTGLS